MSTAWMRQDLECAKMKYRVYLRESTIIPAKTIIMIGYIIILAGSNNIIMVNLCSSMTLLLLS